MNHAYAEEKAVYQALLTKKEQVKDIAREGSEEHDLIKNLFSKLDNLGVTNERWDPTLKVLKELVEHHVEEEESDMFPKLRRQFNAGEKQRMITAFRNAKLSLMGRLRQMVA